ncbi:uncharacterized protein METZ01_LOCUS417897 [marine metagenome]|uniref:Uncharacterized protein n=1 Tax=marine metagenome TaxID=408172 RepID=A0A382X240_9ZZZZ
MYNHEPPECHCPFCAEQNNPESRGWRNNRMGPTLYLSITKDNCLIMPKAHDENLCDLDETIG